VAQIKALEIAIRINVLADPTLTNKALDELASTQLIVVKPGPLGSQSYSIDMHIRHEIEASGQSLKYWKLQAIHLVSYTFPTDEYLEPS
jgi:hypothetical protein